jgi:hypothetical protein
VCVLGVGALLYLTRAEEKQEASKRKLVSVRTAFDLLPSGSVWQVAAGEGVVGRG